MSFFCSKSCHTQYKLTMVCIDKKCGNNEAICHYCLYEKHSEHLVIPIEMFLEAFEGNLSKDKPNYDLTKLRNRISSFSEVKEKYLQKLNDFQKTFNSTIETLKSKLTEIFGSDSELVSLQKANQILDLQNDLQKGFPEKTEDLQHLISLCLKLLSKSEDYNKNLSDFSLFDMKSINNALDLSLSRLKLFDSKLSKIIQKTLKSLENDFRFVFNQISIVKL